MMDNSVGDDLSDEVEPSAWVGAAEITRNSKFILHLFKANFKESKDDFNKCRVWLQK